MSQRLKDQKEVLKMLAKGGYRKRKKLLEGASDETVRCLCECALNTLKSNVPLTADQFRRLRRHKHTLRYLADKRISIAKKKKKVKQAGGFLGPLLLPILGSVLAALIQP
jgi:hypothetical protein